MLTLEDEDRDHAIVTEQFAYQPPRPDDLPRFAAIRAAALSFARVILDNTPRCADQAAALRKVREAVMTANAAIALAGIAHADRNGITNPFTGAAHSRSCASCRYGDGACCADCSAPNYPKWQAALP